MSAAAIAATHSPAQLAMNSLQAPPPYAPPSHNFSHDTDEDEDEEEESVPTTTLHVQASTVVHGSNNVVSSPSPNTAQLVAALATAINQQPQTRTFRIEINCGVHIVGDKNIVGQPALRPLAQSHAQMLARQQAAVAARTAQSGDVSSAVGSKRSATDIDRDVDEDDDEAHDAKRPALDATVGSTPSPPP